MDLCRKRAREEEEEEEEEVVEDEERIGKMKAFLAAVTGFIAAIVAWYHCKLLTRREPLPDWDEHRRFYLNRLSGSEVECMKNLRVSMYGFSKLCQVLYDKGGLRRTRHVSIKESIFCEINEEEIRTVEATNEWTVFHDQLVMDMFLDYQRHQAQQAQQEQADLANVP